jgi:hypothetical protein
MYPNCCLNLLRYIVRNLELLHSHWFHQVLWIALEVVSWNRLSLQGMRWINTKLLHRRLLLIFIAIVIFVSLCPILGVYYS